MRYRLATQADVDAMARIRTEGGWEEGAPAERMGLYLAGKHHPQHALPARSIYVAEDENTNAMLGFVAGHLTTRYSCDGELQWIYVLPDQRGSGVASGLLRQINEWFLSNNAQRICVNVDPRNQIARRFYARHGAQELNEYWMVWSDAQAALAPRART
jgi:GNAT superfamily N-acetyltransferase